MGQWGRRVHSEGEASSLSCLPALSSSSQLPTTFGCSDLITLFLVVDPEGKVRGLLGGTRVGTFQRKEVERKGGCGPSVIKVLGLARCEAYRHEAEPGRAREPTSTGE